LATNSLIALVSSWTGEVAPPSVGEHDVAQLGTQIGHRIGEHFFQDQPFFAWTTSG